MTRFLQVLSGLFVVQLLLVAMVFWPQDSAQYHQQRSLLSGDIAQADRLVVSAAEQQVELIKHDGEWQLSQAATLPVTQGRVDELLRRIAQVRLDWPVATTPAAQQRFEVADDQHQRRVQIFAGEKSLGEFYLGSSPGFRKVHLRQPGESEVYAVTLNSYELPTSSDDWLHKALLAAPQPKAIQGPDYALRKEGDTWVFADQAEGDQLAVDPQKAEALVNALISLQVQGVAHASPSEEGFKLVVESDAGSFNYEFIRSDKDFFVRRNDHPTTFRLSQWEFERITEVGQPQLAKQGEAENSSAKADPSVDQAPKS